MSLFRWTYNHAGYSGYMPVRTGLNNDFIRDISDGIMTSCYAVGGAVPISRCFSRSLAWLVMSGGRITISLESAVAVSELGRGSVRLTEVGARQ